MTLDNNFNGWSMQGGNSDISSLLKLLQQQQTDGMNPFAATAQPANTPGDNIAGALKSLAAYKYNSNGVNLAPQQGIANAMLDESSPLFQKVYGQERGSAQQDLASAIAEAGRQNRKLSVLGRTPLFDPERGGETQFRALTQGYSTAQDSARQRAREILGASYNTQNSLAQQTDANAKKKAFSFGNIADALPSVLKLFK